MSSLPLRFEEFVRLVIDAVEAARVDYMIGGSVGLAAWGDPRTTRDVDLVINLPLEQVYALSQELEKRDMLVPWEIILEVLQQAEGDLPIDAIHLSTGYKAEIFLLRPNDEFRASALARRLIVNLGPIIGDVYVQSPEDLIIYKLRYYQISEQQKHLRDIRTILTAMRDELEFVYLEQWVRYFNLSSAWMAAQTL
jgi:hypothetical protein